MLQIEWEKMSKSKQRNTAIFGAKNIDLLEFCTTNNNNFVWTNSSSITTTATATYAQGSKKERERVREIVAAPAAAAAATTDKNQIHCEHYFNGCGFSLLSYVACFFCFLIPNVYSCNTVWISILVVQKLFLS